MDQARLPSKHILQHAPIGHLTAGQAGTEFIWRLFARLCNG